MAVAFGSAACGSHSSSKSDTTLGLKWNSQVKGYGQAKPSEIDNHGDGTGFVTNIRWDDWGGKTAHGKATAVYVPPNAALAEGTEEPADIVAYNLGTCHGHPAYRAWTVYFPQHGESFKPQEGIDACTGP